MHSDVRMDDPNTKRPVSNCSHPTQYTPDLRETDGTIRIRDIVRLAEL